MIKEPVLLMLSGVVLMVLAGCTMPAVSSPSADWKEEVIDEIFVQMEKVNERVYGGGETEFFMVSGLHNAVAGLCSEFVTRTAVPLPEETVELSVHIHKMLMRGELPDKNNIRRLALQCLTYREEIYVKQGASQEDLEHYAILMKKAMAQHMNQLFGIE